MTKQDRLTIQCEEMLNKPLPLDLDGEESVEFCEELFPIIESNIDVLQLKPILFYRLLNLWELLGGSVVYGLWGLLTEVSSYTKQAIKNKDIEFKDIMHDANFKHARGLQKGIWKRGEMNFIEPLRSIKNAIKIGKSGSYNFNPEYFDRDHDILETIIYNKHKYNDERKKV